MNRVIVAGGINMDMVAYTDTLPKVGESVIGNEFRHFLGGKGANQAIASAKLGAKTTLLGMVGDDDSGKKLIAIFESHGIINIISTSAAAATGTALISVSTKTGDNTIVVIPGANLELSEKHVDPVEIATGDILVSQFEIPVNTIKSFFSKGKQVGTINILNAAPAASIPKELLALVDILILNETELESISGHTVNCADIFSIHSAVNSIRKNNQSIIVTLGEKGVISYINDKTETIAAIKVKAVDTTGAGDCFVGAIAAKIATNCSLQEAIIFANRAASICVTKPGAGISMPTANEVASSI